MATTVLTEPQEKEPSVFVPDVLFMLMNLCIKACFFQQVAHSARSNIEAMGKEKKWGVCSLSGHGCKNALFSYTFPHLNNQFCLDLEWGAGPCQAYG